jgi:GTPase
LLHVVDLSHPAWQYQIRSVMDILGEMPVTPGPILVVFNKVDCVNGENLMLAKEEFPQAAFISASNNIGLSTLRSRISLLVDYAASPDRSDSV